MAIWDPPTEIGLLLYPDVAFATVHGLTDLFAVATTLARERMGANAPMLRVSHWQPNPANDAIERAFDTHPQLANSPTAVIVPGSWQGQPAPEIMQRLVRWLVERHTAGSSLCSVCGGAFVLAGTGLLAGRTATTHWSLDAEAGSTTSPTFASMKAGSLSRTAISSRRAACSHGPTSD